MPSRSRTSPAGGSGRSPGARSPRFRRAGRSGLRRRSSSTRRRASVSAEAFVRRQQPRKRRIGWPCDRDVPSTPSSPPGRRACRRGRAARARRRRASSCVRERLRAPAVREHADSGSRRGDARPAWRLACGDPDPGLVGRDGDVAGLPRPGSSPPPDSSPGRCGATVPSSAFATHTAPAAGGDPRSRRCPTRIVAAIAVGRGVDARDRVVEQRRDPDRALAGGDRRPARTASGILADDLPVAWVEAPELAPECVRRPPRRSFRRRTRSPSNDLYDEMRLVRSDPERESPRRCLRVDRSDRSLPTTCLVGSANQMAYRRRPRRRRTPMLSWPPASESTERHVAPTPRR